MLSGSETLVRMGELAVSGAPDDVLTTIGLGSCIGLVLLDPRRRLAGLAHVVLPESVGGVAAEPGKFADLAVPALREELLALGATSASLGAVLVGGAQMFQFAGKGARMDVGARNEAAVREALAAAGIAVRASATSGSIGRTVRVHVGEGRVSVKAAGGVEADLLAAGGRPVAA